MANIETFNDLKVWRKAHEFVLCIYKLTRDFPSEEKFALVQQLRRAVISVASNIVEGFHRNTINDSLRFYNIAEASLEEVKYQILIARDLNYLTEEIYKKSLDLANEVGRMLNGWVNSQIKNSKKNNKSA